MKKIFIVILILVVASAGGWFVASQFGLLPKNLDLSVSGITNTPVKSAGCESIADKIERGKCFVKECENANYFDACVSSMIPNKIDNAAVCDITTISGSNRNLCFGVFAWEYGDASICDKYSVGDDCYRQVARKTKDASVCNKITDSFNKNACINYDAK